LAFLLPLLGLAAEPVTYASAIALEELAISAAAVRLPSSIYYFRAFSAPKQDTLHINRIDKEINSKRDLVCA